jgi:hypothetical protein
MRKAVEYYGLSLHYLRNTDVFSYRADVLNNLSRALTELGRRGDPMCRDALNLRKKLGAETRIAYSYNTLALIYNELNRPEDAWPLAATALAYFRRSEEARGQGLALIQLSRSLSRLARRAESDSPASPDRLLSVADKLAREAHDLFAPINLDSATVGKRRNLQEPLRWIEAKIELGCVNRDGVRVARMENKPSSSISEQRYKDAQTYLKDAARLAKERGLPRLELEAQVDLAHTYFFRENFDLAHTVLNEVEKRLAAVSPGCLIQPHGDIPDPARDELWVFALLSKSHYFRCRMALDSFRSRAGELEKPFPDEADREKRRQIVHADREAQTHLNQAAEMSVLGIAYAQLFSPRSPVLAILHDRLYSYLKSFNPVELDDFHRYTFEKKQAYPALQRLQEKLSLADDLDQFLHEFVGLPHEHPPALQHRA